MNDWKQTQFGKEYDAFRQELDDYYAAYPTDVSALEQELDEKSRLQPQAGAMEKKTWIYELAAEKCRVKLFRHCPFYFEVDTGAPRNLAQLLHAVAESVRPHNVWVRVLYLQPEGMTDELIATIRDVDEVLPYIDIPIQHCSERVLASMGRSGSTEQLREHIKRAVADEYYEDAANIKKELEKRSKEQGSEEAPQ